jgi:subtilisin family serine protease
MTRLSLIALSAGLMFLAAGPAASEERGVATASTVRSFQSECTDARETYSPTQTLPWGVQRVWGSTPQNFPATSTRAAWIIDSGIAGAYDGAELNVKARKVCTVAACAPDLEKIDRIGHGTVIAGIIGAMDNGVGVVGVAPGAPLNSLRIFGRRAETNPERILTALTWLAANIVSDANPATPSPDDVVNLSLGMDWIPSDTGLQNDIEAKLRILADKGMKIAVAAGNIDTLRGQSGYVQTVTPARAGGYRAVSGSGAIMTVSAFQKVTDRAGTRDVFWKLSVFGNAPKLLGGGVGFGPPDFAEPGVDIVSLWPPAGTALGDLAKCSGTSFAAAHLSGLLLWGTPSVGGHALEDPSAEIPGSVPINYEPSLLDPIGVH